jgi:hypothetical protein
VAPPKWRRRMLRAPAQGPRPPRQNGTPRPSGWDLALHLLPDSTEVPRTVCWLEVAPPSRSSYTLITTARPR